MSENPLTIFGLEGTAWNLSAALVNEEGVIYEKSATYTPAIGGIHPREASQHHAEFMAKVVGDVLARARVNGLKLDAIAFSQGPGLGPCLRTVATAARARTGASSPSPPVAPPRPPGRWTEWVASKMTGRPSLRIQ